MLFALFQEERFFVETFDFLMSEGQSIDCDFFTGVLVVLSNKKRGTVVYFRHGS